MRRSAWSGALPDWAGACATCVVGKHGAWLVSGLRVWLVSMRGVIGAGVLNCRGVRCSTGLSVMGAKKHVGKFGAIYSYSGRFIHTVVNTQHKHHTTAGKMKS